MKQEGRIQWIIAIILLITWCAAALLSKSGFVHVLLLCAIGMSVVQAVAEYRVRLKSVDAENERR